MMQDKWIAQAVKDYEEYYPALWAEIFESGLEQDSLYFLGPAMYLLTAGNRALLIDPQLRLPLLAEKIMPRLAGDLAQVSSILLTHEHGDHYAPDLLAAVQDLPLQLLIPHFFDRERIAATGIAEKNIVWLADDAVIKDGPFLIQAFASPHLGLDGQGVPELGYLLKTPAASLLFPTDVRNYDRSLLPGLGPVDYLIQHVWLGRTNALNYPCQPFLSQLADFVNALDPALVFLSHLYEISRPATDLWSYAHAGFVMDELLAKNSRLLVEIPRPGDRYDLKERVLRRFSRREA